MNSESSTEKESVVIVGYGWVGQANALALRKMGYPTYFFDLGEPSEHYTSYKRVYEEIGRLKSVLEKDSPSTVYMVCVGDRVSPTGEQDISSIKKALESVKDAQGMVILRSTIRPDYLRTLDFDIYLPEFLHEKKGVEECLDPHFFVVGKKDSQSDEPSFFADWRRRSYEHIDCTPEEASHIKYLSNIWNALRIAFVNEFGRSIHTDIGIDKAQNVLHFLFGDKPYFNYGRAFTGHCLPKDMRAYTAYSSQRIDPKLLQGILDSNTEQEAFQAIHTELQEWYSPWRRIDLSGTEALKALGRAIKRRVFKKQD